jgi:hypothetical protein
VRLTRCPLCSDSDQLPQRSKTTRCANSGREQVQQGWRHRRHAATYSMTSAAAASSIGRVYDPAAAAADATWHSSYSQVGQRPAIPGLRAPVVVEDLVRPHLSGKLPWRMLFLTNGPQSTSGRQRHLEGVCNAPGADYSRACSVELSTWAAASESLVDTSTSGEVCGSSRTPLARRNCLATARQR